MELMKCVGFFAHDFLPIFVLYVLVCLCCPLMGTGMRPR